MTLQPYPRKRRLPTSKVQRWIDLLAALLNRRFPVSFEKLVHEVPAYASAAGGPALQRMFERDKDELRSLGIPLETVPIDGGDAVGYRLDGKKFYLPYLTIAGAASPRSSAGGRIDREGYRALGTIEFEPDQLAVIGQAASRIRELGNPLLAADAESAMRKLALDVPITPGAPDDVRVITRSVPDRGVFDALSDALSRRKVVTFDYHSMSRDRTERRTVEPYGLFFLGSNWYLAARDRDRGEMRNFRLNRVTGVAVNTKRSQTSDYDIPADFDLRRHARSRQAWELGDGDSVTAIVEFSKMTGAAAAASKLGEPVANHPDRRTFRVRRLDAFARWLLSFGGDAMPVEPPTLVDAFTELLAATGAIYRDDGARDDPTHSPVRR